MENKEIIPKKPSLKSILKIKKENKISKEKKKKKEYEPS